MLAKSLNWSPEFGIPDALREHLEAVCCCQPRRPCTGAVPEQDGGRKGNRTGEDGQQVPDLQLHLGAVPALRPSPRCCKKALISLAFPAAGLQTTFSHGLVVFFFWFLALIGSENYQELQNAAPDHVWKWAAFTFT